MKRISLQHHVPLWYAAFAALIVTCMCSTSCIYERSRGDEFYRTL